MRKDYIGFAAAHFVLFDRGACETLHGHNYRVGALVEGRLDKIGYVIDFVKLKASLKEGCNLLDHKLLLPANNRALDLNVSTRRVMARYGRKAYTLPVEDVVLLPIENTTAEHLARWFGMRLCAQLWPRRGGTISRIEVEVEESPGQAAVWSRAATVKDCVRIVGLNK